MSANKPDAFQEACQAVNHGFLNLPQSIYISASHRDHLCTSLNSDDRIGQTDQPAEKQAVQQVIRGEDQVKVDLISSLYASFTDPATAD